VMFVLCFLPFALSAQYFNPGTDPASVRWNQVRSQHFRIIYPRNLDSQAVYIANALEYFRIPGSASMEALPGKWPVILHNRTIISSANTPYAPKRIEMITTPPQDNEDTFGQDWIDQLIIHEFRHTVQYASVDRGMTKAFTYLLGQQALPGILGLFVPWWCIEGDAVVTETANSQTGRGRVPAYEMKLRSQFLERGIYRYDKAVNGSFRDFIPDCYELGYLMVGHTRAEFGRETWSRVMRKTGNIPLMLVPFSNTLYKETGYGKSRLYDHITSNLDQTWHAADNSLSLTSFSPELQLKDKFYTNHTQPAVLEDGRIIALKKSINDFPRIVLIDPAGKESLLLNPGTMTDNNLSVSSKLLCYSETAYDPRWYYRAYSVIRIVNLETGQKRKITHKTRYFSPHISWDSKKIVTVFVNETNQYYLFILDAENGEVMHRFPTPENYFPDHPSFSPDGEQVAVVLTRAEGKSLAVAGANDGEFEFVLPFSNTEISRPCFFSPYIFFTGAYTGTDNIFAFNLDTRKLYQVTSSRFGATDATVSPEGSRLYYADYSSGGFSIVSAEINPKYWKEFDPLTTHRWELAEKMAGQEDFTFKSAEVPDSAYNIKPYRKGLNLFNFHSWAPLSIDIENMEAYPGVMIMSQNLLGSSNLSLGYAYDRNEETGKYYLKYSYQGLFPALDLETDYGLRRDVYTDPVDSTQVSYKYNELNFSAGLRVPLNWNIKSWRAGIQMYAGYSLNFLQMVPGTEMEFEHDRVNSLDGYLYLNTSSPLSYRDLQPKWGQNVQLNFRDSPFDSETPDRIFAAQALIYFPGFAKHHGFKFYGGYQNRQVDHYRYSGFIVIPRGLSEIYSNHAFSGSVDYVAPLVYPDWNIGPVFYLKRIRAAAFYDMMFDFDNSSSTIFQSCGLDITFNFHLFRLFVPIEAGLRTIYLPEKNRFEYQFIYYVNMGDLY
jgi:Tol biopolymer transport system component